MKSLFKSLTVLLVVLLCLQVPTARAIELDREDYSIELHYNLPLRVSREGISFQLWHVATLTEDIQFRLCEDVARIFADYSVSLDVRDTDDWLSLADYAYPILRNAKAADGSALTDSAGYVSFTGLTQGLYLVVGEKTISSSGIVYMPTPFFAYVPFCTEDGNWSHEYFAEVKYTAEELGTVSRRVVKLWNDGGATGARPVSVTVELRRDGEPWDTQVLSASNNWRTTWEGLDNRYNWTVVELDVASGYIVSSEVTGATTVLTNSRGTTRPPVHEDPPEGDTPTPSHPDTPEESTPTVPDTPVPEDDIPDAEIPDQDVPLSDFPTFEEITDPRSPSYIPDDDVYIPDDGVPLSKLPQTGQLWWPVLPLLITGVILFLSGLILRRSKSDEDA